MSVKTKEINPSNMKNIIRMNNFNDRWGISDVENRNDLKTRCLLVVSKLIASEISNLYSRNPLVRQKYDRMCYDLSMIIGLQYTQDMNVSFEHSKIYHYLSRLDLNNESDYRKFIYFLEVLINYDSEIINKEQIAISLSEVSKLSGANFRIIKDKGDYIMLPLSVDFLDSPLIIDNLNWLNEYKNSKEHFLKAIQFDRNENYYRNIIDELRLSLEFLFQQLFNNRKTLENQMTNIGNYFKENYISVFISNMYIKLLKIYTDYNNDNVKHGDCIMGIEIDYLIYLTGSFIRLIVQIESTKKEI